MALALGFLGFALLGPSVAKKEQLQSELVRMQAENRRLVEDNHKFLDTALGYISDMRFGMPPTGAGRQRVIEFSPIRLTDNLVNAKIDLILILFTNILFFMCAYLFFLRSDVK